MPSRILPVREGLPIERTVGEGLLTKLASSRRSPPVKPGDL
ncbi:MAG: hypothetical protein PHW11_05805 [Anaerolineaceae bacterium]|nr:hypothetical protein [Anaerolineaceae bacterium]MDD4042790.1 hypothetical protein [Anaerolineaceae bacterium]MDD4577387.1 hypothetical protein [Anaerolineaceae bacterium]